jgi:hypothetical protein
LHKNKLHDLKKISKYVEIGVIFATNLI